MLSPPWGSPPGERGTSSGSEMEKLQAELERLQKRLSAYEGPDGRMSLDEEKRRIRRIFDAFDMDKSDDLDAEEFQELAYLLGEALELEEVKERIKAIDQDDNGRIDFKEFFDWWISPDHDFLKLKKTDDYRLLKAKLGSKALMRTITQLNDAVASDSFASSSMSKINIAVSVGKINESPCDVRINYVDDPARAAAFRGEMDASEEDTGIFSVSLTMKNGVSDFDLGEISGSLKTLLAMAKQETMFSSYRVQLTTEGKTRVFRIVLLVDKAHYPKFEEIHKFVEAIHPRHFNLNLELSQTPDQHNPRQSLDFKLNIKGETSKTSLEVIRDFLKRELETKEMIATSKFPTMGMTSPLYVHALSLLRTLNFELQMDTLQELLQELEGESSDDQDAAFPLNGWSMLKPLLKQSIAKFLLSNREDTPAKPTPFFDTYLSSLKVFEGIHSARFQVGDRALELTAKNLNIFSLMPTEEELNNPKSTTDDFKRRKGQKRLQRSSNFSSNFASYSEDLTDSAYSFEEGYSSSGSAYSDFEPGIIHTLMNRPGNEDLLVFSTPLGRGGTAAQFINPDPHEFCWTINQPNAWFCVDIGDKKKILPSRYRLRYGSSGSSCCPRRWILQGAERLTRKMDDMTSPDWQTLRVHIDDKSFLGNFASTSWDIPPFPGMPPMGYRYFRVVQTGPNSYECPPNTEDLWSNVLVATGFELYGQLNEVDERDITTVETPGRKEFQLLYDSDTNGIVYYLRQHGVKIGVTASSIARGQPRDFIKRGQVYCWTQNRPFSWFMVDFGKRRKVCPSNYIIRYGSGGSGCCPRNWLFQGATELRDKTSNPDSEDWTTLTSHKNDKSLKDPHSLASFHVPNDGSEFFRYFRIIQTGPNAFTGGPGWKDVLVASGFEIYGILQTDEMDEDADEDESEEWSEMSDGETVDVGT
eukprot:TRINITY_DN316_c0_g1_i11.p1 TRINITY_DN316_c0_g1~~TRINITY_DN316_c0_g1_i11.p1  ORF type:complete len:926 (+),score=240.93 TRINITY_DN316_c0_g1_i11:118-2895(+)